LFVELVLRFEEMFNCLIVDSLVRLND
jgi:hypothetical protein